MPTSFPVDRFHFKSDSIFEDLPVEDIEFLKSKMREQRYKKGQTIFVEGTYPAGIFYVKKGKIKKYKTDRDGKEQIFYVCNPGELLGYPALLSEEPYSDSASALEDSVVALIPKDDFLRVLSCSSILSNKLLKNLSHEFGVLVNGIATFAHRSVRERLALALLVLKEKYRIKGEENKPVEINLSREDLSNLVGTAVETVVRLLHDFKEEGLVSTNGRKIRILDAKRLVKVANFY
jgi:CRP-like cAMP-binding protein